jgi:hypothetical protein
MARIPGSACIFIVAGASEGAQAGQSGAGLVIIPLQNIHPEAAQHG